MFTIVISEKGGAERRETFEKNEVNVGRVQGNDLMLPKGNVSKHHARLLYRDGRFIVTDLKSTNGTYVNGRKISQATIVREGDKIYVGDFVLRLEAGGKAAAKRAEVDYAGSDDATGGAEAPSAAASPADGVPAAPAARAGVGTAPTATASAGATPGVDASGSGSDSADGDDDSSPSGEVEPASSPAVAGAASTSAAAPSIGVAPAAPTQLRTNTIAHPTDRPAAPRRPSPAASAPRSSRSMPPAPPGPRSLPRETSQQVARRLALITLVDRVADAMDLAPLDKNGAVPEVMAQAVERAVREQARAMRDEGEAPGSVDLEALARDASRELLGLGALGPLLDDDETRDIHVVRPDCVLAIRAGGQTVLADPPFTSEAALRRLVARLAHQSGEPLRAGEAIVDRRLARGGHMTAVGPPSSSGWVVHVQKRRRVESTLPDLVRDSTLSEAIASFFETCARARANVLVFGSGERTMAPLLAAIAAAAAPGERIAVVQHRGDEISVPQAHVTAIAIDDHGARGEQAVHAAGRLGVDRMIVTSLAGNVAASALDVIAEGGASVLAGAGAPSLQPGLARLVAQVALARPGASLDAARAAVAESFDVIVELVRTPAGASRVRRVAEVSGLEDKRIATRDLFVWNANGGAAEAGAYVATGVSAFLEHAGE